MTEHQAIVIDILLDGESATERLAGRIASVARAGDVLALAGDLGAGKTVFARAFIRTLTGDPETEVPSPTFTLVQGYDGEGGEDIRHFDLYRLERPDDALELDIEDAFAYAVSLVEWPERLGPWLPPRRLLIRLDHGAAKRQRRARISGDEAWAARLRETNLDGT